MNGSLKSFQSRLLKWYQAHHRKLPWRVVGADAHRELDAYHVLVSEAMLQQTQVVTVIPYYHRFIERFPTVHALAGADQQEVLRLWQGLGYYSRARNLQKAAQEVVSRFDGRVPDTAEALLSLPGVGRYTAGAIASIAHNRRAPILDGNVARVLCRIDAIEADPREKATNALLWARAEEILPHERLGDFNSALMELGATVCTPRSPQCFVCPVREHCAAQAKGLQERIPPAKKAKETPLERRLTICVRAGDRWLIEQRPSTGRWAGMWQFVTVAAPEGMTLPTPEGKALLKGAVRDWVSMDVSAARSVGLVTHALTHRRYEFHVYAAVGGARPWDGGSAAGKTRAWVTLADLDRYPLPRPHLKIAALLRDLN